jgi:hypothetical protein
MHPAAIASQDAVKGDVPQPSFKHEGAQQAAHENGFPAPSFFDGFNESIRIDNPDRTTDEWLISCESFRVFREVIFRALRSSEGFRSVQDFVRYDTDERALHQRATLAHTNDLASRDCIHEFEEITVKIGIT